MTGGGLPVIERKEVPAWRLIATLGSAGGLAGFLLVFVFGWTQPIIQAYKAEQLRLAVQEVLKAPDHYDTLYVFDGAVTGALPAGQDPSSVEQIYLGYRDAGDEIGFALAAERAGFQDKIRIIFGYDRTNRSVLGMKVLESKETPGLGDKIEKDSSFVAQFDGVAVPLVGVKPRKATGDVHEIDVITGATISSQTIIKIINETLERLGPMIDAYAPTRLAEGTP
jgi:electron transport complex protein RnfG